MSVGRGSRIRVRHAGTSKACVGSKTVNVGLPTGRPLTVMAAIARLPVTGGVGIMATTRVIPPA